MKDASSKNSRQQGNILARNTMDDSGKQQGETRSIYTFKFATALHFCASYIPKSCMQGRLSYSGCTTHKSEQVSLVQLRRLCSAET